MIDLYTWTTPNGRKVSIMLEECGLPYTVHPIDISNGKQFEQPFQTYSPNGRIPAIVDNETPDGPVSIFESGAILVYLAEKTGKFLPAAGKARSDTMQWLMWQMAGVGPMLGQANHFATAAEEKIPYAIDRYITESARLISVMDRQLADNEFLAETYSIADMATYPWIKLAFELIKSAKPEIVGDGVHTSRWLAAIDDRPAVQKGMAVPEI